MHIVFEQCDNEKKHGLKMEDVDMEDLQNVEPHKDYAKQASGLVCQYFS